MRKLTLWVLCLGGFGYIFIGALLDETSSCKERESEVRQAIHEGAACKIDADCIVMTLTCPFECQTPVNRNAQQNVVAALSTYNSSCMTVCPDCPKAAIEASCVSGRCQVGPRG